MREVVDILKNPIKEEDEKINSGFYRTNNKNSC